MDRNKHLQIKFGWQLVAFMIAIEVFTIPFVALSNTFVIDKTINIVVMGFVVAFVALVAIIWLIKNSLKKYFTKLLGQEVKQLKGILYIGFISGFLLMFMFYLQEVADRYANSDYIISFTTTLVSVGTSLLIYYLIEKIFKYGIKLVTKSATFLVTIKLIDILILTILFSLYEIIAYKISGIWIPHHENRFFWGLLSGFGAGFLGGVTVLIITKITQYKFNLYLNGN